MIRVLRPFVRAVVWVLDHLMQLPTSANDRVNAAIAGCLWCGSPDHDGVDCPKRPDCGRDGGRP